MKKKFSIYFLFIVIIIVGIGAYFVFKPFVVAIIFAFIISQLFRGWYQKINNKFRNRKSLASLATCLLVFLILIIPFFATLGLIASEANSLYQESQQNNQNINLNETIDKIAKSPIVEKLGLDTEKFSLKNILDSEQFTQITKNIGGYTIVIVKKTYQGASHFAFVAFVTFFALYYFFKDGDRMIKKIMKLSPLPDKQEKLLLEKFVGISRSTLKGSLIIAIIQGVLMGIVFWIAGVGSPAIWGLVTAILSLIPILGAVLVWLPVGVFLLLTGDFWQAFFVLAAGAIIVSSVDNVLRPKLVGNDARLHPLLVFLSTLGGIVAFGFAGFIIGPIIIVLFVALLDIYENEFKKELTDIN
jgi:predicted PurR-regulated permease PerM